MTKSLAYRNNEAAIWSGEVPEKYRRLLPYIHGDTVLEIGSAEGVLALALADAGKSVIALEKNQERFDHAVRLKEQWRALGRRVDGCIFAKVDVREVIRSHHGVFGVEYKEIDAVVAVRSIYYLREEAQDVVRLINVNRIPQIVLCGNRNRAAWTEEQRKQNSLGEWNYYASIEGMTELLTRAGYEIATVVKEGDPIVVGRYPNIS